MAGCTFILSNASKMMVLRIMPGAGVTCVYLLGRGRQDSERWRANGAGTPLLCERAQGPLQLLSSHALEREGARAGAA